MAKAVNMFEPLTKEQAAELIAVDVTWDCGQTTLTLTIPAGTFREEMKRVMEKGGSPMFKSVRPAPHPSLSVSVPPRS